jgi:hypothetical protein
MRVQVECKQAKWPFIPCDLLLLRARGNSTGSIRNNGSN